MSYVRLVAETRRRVLLDVLLHAPAKRANDRVLRAVVESRVDVVDRSLVRADMSYLEAHGLIGVDKLAAEGEDVWIGTLTDAGAAVARGRAHQGIADRELG